MNQIPQMKRVDSVDALRGFAVVAIMLLHFVEHFIYGVYPEATSKTAELLNQSVWDALFFIFAGKSYTVFALLFGFTFIVQQRNQEAKGGDFGGRFAWRLVILMFFATLNAAFFPGGDVLLLFAIMGFVMIPLRKLSQRNLLLIASLFLIQPIELLECFGIDFIPTLLNDTYYPTLKIVTDSGNFWDMIVANAGIGQLASLFWAVDTGRLLQAPGLFILGMILARGDYFSRGAGFWVKTFVGSFIASFLFYVAKTSAVDALQIILTMWYNMAFTGMLVSMFVILYQNDVFVSQRNLLLIASLFLIQPIELLECFGIDFIPTLLNDTYYPTLKIVTDSGNFWDMIVANAGIGQLASLFWAVDTGRLLQAPGLFILGMILARGDYFSRGAGFWVKTFVGSFIASFLFYVAKTSAVDALQIILTMWYNMAFTGMLVSMFVILYQNDVFGRMTDGLRFYGRMSLTNYISQSIIGSLIFFPYALGLASTLGIAWSFVVGLGVMSAQIWFCRRWLRTHRQGPLEAVWHRLTWLK